jgi:hypothetical protein
MIATLIAGASVVALFPLFVSYCENALAAAKKVGVSERVSALADARGRSLSAEDFGRILELVRLCPEYDPDHYNLRAVTIYYRLIEGMNRVFGRMSPGFAAWSERERGNCAHFAAVVLDRCISSSRNLIAQQAGDRL